jgi:hypothetical protein
MVIAGLFFHRKRVRLVRDCITRTTGDVVRVERHENVAYEPDDDDDALTTKRTSVSYRPIFLYDVDGVRIEKASATASGRCRFTQGQLVTVCYDPADPQRSYVVEDKADGRFGIALMLFGAAVTIFGVVSLLFDGQLY